MDTAVAAPAAAPDAVDERNNNCLWLQLWLKRRQLMVRRSASILNERPDDDITEAFFLLYGDRSLFFLSFFFHCVRGGRLLQDRIDNFIPRDPSSFYTFRE